MIFVIFLGLITLLVIGLLLLSRSKTFHRMVDSFSNPVDYSTKSDDEVINAAKQKVQEVHDLAEQKKQDIEDAKIAQKELAQAQKEAGIPKQGKKKK